MAADAHKARLEAAARAYLDVREAEDALTVVKQRLTNAERNLPDPTILNGRPAVVNLTRGVGTQATRVIMVISGHRNAAGYDYIVAVP